jgi:hypothetical protein
MAETTPIDTQVLLDKDAIEERLYEFYYRCDAGDVPGAIVRFATEDVSFDAGPMGAAESRDGWREWAETVYTEEVPFARHMIHNPIIDVDGDEASAKYYAEIPSIIGEGDAVWAQGTYEVELRRVDGEWKFSSYAFEFTYATPYDRGWAEQPFVEGIPGELDW